MSGPLIYPSGAAHSLNAQDREIAWLPDSP